MFFILIFIAPFTKLLCTACYVYCHIHFKYRKILPSFFNIDMILNIRIMASLGFIGPLPKFRVPLDTKAPGPPLIYQVGPLAISDPQCFPQVGGSKFDGGPKSENEGSMGAA